MRTDFWMSMSQSSVIMRCGEGKVRRQTLLTAANQDVDEEQTSYSVHSNALS